VKDLLHYTSTRSTDRANAWLTEDQTILPVALAVDNKVRIDILVIESWATAQLASVGLGLMTPEDYVATHAAICAGMKDENVNWIIVPCCDGMTRQADIDYAASKRADTPVEPVENVNDPFAGDATTTTHTNAGADSNKSKTAKNYYAMGSSQGTHWGVMIIDKAKNEARWLDGALKFVHKNGKVYVGAMLPAVRIAGKALCGYDRVTNLPCSKFEATTLKHVPTDHSDNLYKEDKGCACGPWVFAIIQYILDNDAFLTDEHGLKGTFASNRKARHVQSMAFNSMSTKKAINQMVQEELYRQEPDIVPYRLTPQVARILNVFNPDGFLKQVRDLQKKGQASRSGKGGKGGRDHDDEDEENSSDDDDDESGTFDDTDISKSTLMALVRGDPSGYSHLTTKHEKMRQALENQRELEKSIETARAAKKKAAKEEAASKEAERQKDECKLIWHWATLREELAASKPRKFQQRQSARLRISHKTRRRMV
jgi:hypothetical protein